MLNCNFIFSITNGDINIYNVGTSDNTAKTLGEFADAMLEAGEVLPVYPCIWYPFIIYVSSHVQFMVLAFLLHVLPGCLLDLPLRLINKPPM
ncbi:hypothetical protein PR048_022734 [Dryococelus australis]|uniref:Uncharacterized protein n=1 Tax=Dryococelus australis TaxID=614101 RepID=A0ABQ9GS75_9NEOP|nr:hypothetical protein PR048_022734 [Dryococelus australis]